jgi:hypothetical protein
MRKNSKYHAKCQALDPNCCKYKANGSRKEVQQKKPNLIKKKSSSPWHCPKKLDKTTQNPADYHHFFGPRFNNLLRVVLETRIHTQPWFRIL